MSFDNLDGTTINSFYIGNLATLDGYVNIYANINTVNNPGIRWNNNSLQWENTSDSISWKKLSTNQTSYHIFVGKAGALTDGADGYLLQNLTEITDESFAAYIINTEESSLTLKRLKISCSTIAGGGESVTIVARVNNTDTLLTATLTDASPVINGFYMETDTVNTINVIDGDFITIRYISSAAASVQNLSADVEISS